MRTVAVTQYLTVKITTNVEIPDPDQFPDERGLRHYLEALPVNVSVESMLDNDSPINKVKVLGVDVDWVETSEVMVVDLDSHL